VRVTGFFQNIVRVVEVDFVKWQRGMQREHAGGNALYFKSASLSLESLVYPKRWQFGELSFRSHLHASK
jgi:hypothetical protein